MDVHLPSPMPRSHVMSYTDASANVWDWLSVLRLEQYTVAFQNAGLTTLQQCRNLTPDQLGRIGVTLPGHQRRILASLNKAQASRDTQPVTHSSSGLLESTLQLEDMDSADDLLKEKYLLSAEEPLDNRDTEIQRPVPRERTTPVPKERQPASQEDGGGVDGERDRPVPKERTKFSVNVPVKYPPGPASFSSSPPDSALPPVPPRSSTNCPPQPFLPNLSPMPPPPQIPDASKPERHNIHGPTVQKLPYNATSTSTPSSPAAQKRPQTLDIQPHCQYLHTDEARKTSSFSPSASTISDKHAPPLPPKVSTGSKGPSLTPGSVPTPPRTNSFSPTETSKEMDNSQAPQVPPRIKTPQRTENLQLSSQLDNHPSLPVRRVSQTPSEINLPGKNSDANEDADLLHHNSLDKEVLLPVQSQTKGRCHSWLSDDDLLDEDDDGDDDDDDDNNATLRPSSYIHGSVYLPSSDRRPSAAKDDSTQSITAVIKMGWLDKNPPQGGLYYQRRWVKLDVDYLRYFDSEKDIYSKGIISTAFITNVASIGELKFEVATNNRTFIFRAENEAERNDWVAVLQDCTRGRYHRSNVGPGSPLAPDHHGYLELKGLRSKLYTVVALDKVFLYKTIDDYRMGVGITSIEMNVGNVKDSERRNFELTTPYRIFSFIAESEQQRELWVGAMRNAIGEALSNSEVADQIWAEPSNSFCADCGAAKPEWAAINLCVVVCKQCAGEHRGLGPSVSKVRSLKMDRKVWTEELIQVFLSLGNERANSFWAASVPPSEALTPSSCSEERRQFITNKYRQGKYRKYHMLYGNQSELNNALCVNIQCSDLLETLSLIFCGADVNCSTGMSNWPSPLSLANARSQHLQAEIISHNLNTDLPHSGGVVAMLPVPQSKPPCVSHHGLLYKTASMARAVTERKAREEFSRRWCTLNDGVFSYYESDKNSSPNGTLKVSEIVSLAIDAPEKHGYENTFEIYTESERLYLFGTDDAGSHKEWVKSIARSFIPTAAEPLLKMSFERIGRLKCKDGLNLQTSRLGWFALVGSTLHASLEDGQCEEIHLRKVNELSTQQDNGVLVLVEKGRTLYIEGERKLDFAGWCAAIRSAGRSGGDTLSQQQLTETDIPVIVHSCIGYITQCGLTSEGIYRKSGVNSRVKALCERFRCDARSLCLREGEHQVDDVSSTLKRFFRELEEGLFTSVDASSWLSTAAIQDESVKIAQYQQLLNRLPRVNKATLQALINHLYCVQRFSDRNQMNLHNLAIVFGPTLFQIDGKDFSAGITVEDLIQHYTLIFEVDEQQLKKQLEEITIIIEVREKMTTKFPSTEPGGHFICTVYLEEKKETAEQHVKIPGSMTAMELTCEVLHRRNIPFKDKDYWCCWEVSNKEEMERPLHYQERVLPILHALGTDSHLVIKKHLAMEAMITLLSSKLDAAKHGMMKFREERSILGLGLGLTSGNFHDRYFILNSSSLRMYKEVRSNRSERDWPVKNLNVYLGIRKRLRPPTCWGLTVVCDSKKPDRQEKQQFYVCCESQSEMREWYANFLNVQYNGDVWPQDGLPQTRVSQVMPNTHHGNVSLIPLRGSENEMRNSVAAFSQDPLSVS